jgi:DNA-directed RNA polymerase subunit RPC12/RpoP
LNEPRIFLCHASEDKPRVAELYHKLKAAGYHSWRGKEDLLPGQDWRHAIEQIIRDPTTIVVACLSGDAVANWGAVMQAEATWALDVLEQMSPDARYLIPALLDRCDLPYELWGVRWVNLFEPDGFERLKQALDAEIAKRSEGQEQSAEVQEGVQELQYFLSQYSCPYCGARLVAKEIQTVYGLSEYEDADVWVVRYECGYATEGADEVSPCSNRKRREGED